MSTKRPFSDVDGRESNHQHHDAEENEEDTDFGPKLAQNAEYSGDVEIDQKDGSKTEPRRRKSAIPPHMERIYLASLPSSSFYEHSYMHRDIVTQIVVSKHTEFIITASTDGHVKFWKKMKDNIEFVKHYQAHLGTIHGLVLSPDGARLVTTGEDKMIKFFEVAGFDLSHMINVSYIPTAASWLTEAQSSSLFNRVAIADGDSPYIRIYRTDGQLTPVAEISVHRSPVQAMALNRKYNTIISADMKGMIEYWDTESLQSPALVKFQYKSETDLYDLMKSKTKPSTLSVSPLGDLFVIISTDKIIRVFDFLSGKVRRKYDESVKVYKSGAAGSVAVGGLDSIELGRREAIERELESSSESLNQCNALFDDSGNYLVSRRRIKS